jgi:hypothetical protein
MRNAVTPGPRQNRFDGAQPNLELLGDFRCAQPVIEVINDRADGHSCAAQYRRAALHLRVGLHQRTTLPIDLSQPCHRGFLNTMMASSDDLWRGVASVEQR